MNKLKCDICGTEGVQARAVSRSYGTGKDLLVVEEIPLVSCPHCGESYFTADTLYELERIKLHRNGFAEKRPVAVAKYHHAA